MSQKVFYSITVALLLAACTKKEAIETPDTRFQGTWEWIKTDGGIANNIHETPQSTGKSVSLKLTADNKYVITANDAITSQGTFTVETKKCIHDGTNKTFLNFSAESDKDMLVESIGDNTLTLSDEAHDGLISVYGRQNGNIK
ncbi:MAG TPA: hypothetical protein VGN63_19855 [Flavisolibacter sp.]|nr:hypothetical protein [Flavisolibacter sp.]